MMQVDLQLGVIEESLEKFSEKIKTNVIRAGSQAAAQVFYEEAKNRVPVSNKGHWFHGTMFKVNGTKYFFEAGTLKKSIYQVFSQDNSDKSKATYHVAWNHQECPYGFMVEFGTSRAPAHPFLKPAYEAMKGQAYTAAIQKMKESL